ncbi:MAG TPA: hypothetical protein VEQ85_15025 [Lacipirellulaceae bacterium]|nr:hypothetical protein [Lacipirellulaceae bacterium]
MASPRVVRDFVCTACGCVCDDLAVTVDGNRIVGFDPPCPVAAKFLLGRDEEPAGAPDPDPLIDEAANLLRAARAPLVMGLHRASVDAQRTAAALADRLGAIIDPADDKGRGSSARAAQSRGVITATLGEAAGRSDVVLYWQCDPATTHPRHMERFASRAGQRVLAVTAWPSPTAALAHEYLLVPESLALSAVSVLRAVLRGVPLDPDRVEEHTGSSLEVWQRLAEQLLAARYLAIFAEGDDAQAEALTALVDDLHQRTRAALVPLGKPYNAVGAAQVLAWQTGFPAAVSFAPGYPDYQAGEAVAELVLARGEADVVLIVGTDPLAALPRAAAAHLRAIPSIVLDDRDTATMRQAAVAIRTAPFGIAEPGDVFRSDGVALPLRPVVRSASPSAADVLERILARL